MYFHGFTRFLFNCFRNTLGIQTGVNTGEDGREDTVNNVEIVLRLQLFIAVKTFEIGREVLFVNSDQRKHTCIAMLCRIDKELPVMLHAMVENSGKAL